MFLISYPGGVEESAVKAATAWERPNVREDEKRRGGRERERAVELQQPSTCWWWSVRISHISYNAPAMPSKWVLSPPHQEPPQPPTSTQLWHKSSSSNNAMLSGLGWEELASLSLAGGRRKIGSYLVSSDICVWLCNRPCFGEALFTLQLANQLAYGFICCALIWEVAFYCT